MRIVNEIHAQNHENRLAEAVPPPNVSLQAVACKNITGKGTAFAERG